MLGEQQTHHDQPIPRPDQAAITRLTLAAQQRALTIAELADYLEQHAALANVIATAPRLVTGAGDLVVPELQRTAHAMNASMFMQAVAALRNRMMVLDQTIHGLKAQAQAEGEKFPDGSVGRSLWEARVAGLEDVRLLLGV